jgi:hypothetical protein
MVTIPQTQLYVNELRWQAIDAAVVEAEIESVLDLLNEHLIDVRDAASRLNGLYETLHQVSDGAPRWGDYIPFDGSVVPPADELADDGQPVACEWAGMYSEVIG